MYWRSADVSANGPSMRSPGRYIGAAGMSAPPTKWPVLVVKVHQVLKDEFDQLYAEGAQRRRMMVVGTHDRISGRPNRIRVLEEFITYAQTHSGVWFATKQEIAHWALQTPEVTLQVEREKPEISGMPAGHLSVKV